MSSTTTLRFYPDLREVAAKAAFAPTPSLPGLKPDKRSDEPHWVATPLGKAAAAAGARTSDQAALLGALASERASTYYQTSFKSDGDIARAAGLSLSACTAAIEQLIMRGVLRREIDRLGVGSLAVVARS